jgi:hypothetical protein
MNPNDRSFRPDMTSPGRTERTETNECEFTGGKMKTLLLSLILAGAQTVLTTPNLPGKPPNIPCHLGDQFYSNGERWDCAFEGDMMDTTTDRWVKHVDAQSTPTTDETALRQSIDVKLAPRSLLLSGGDVDSPSGKYLIDFPPPNECVQLGPIRANSRSFALYRAISQGGFTLKPASGGLTVWTIEEWNALAKGKWYAEFKKVHDAKCVKGNQK